ncbi:MAG: prepilin peptidase [Lachnospiraceae bacterium]|nr:prepilin peptidase [Lachnospiraceae bacterium]MBQ8548073.1 prepilin peptidase [Lachnospiraceae bacterium]
MGEVWRELLALPTLLWLALQDKKHLGITRWGLVIASGLLLLAGCFHAIGWQSRVGGVAVGALILLFGYFSKEAIGMADGVVISACGAAFGIYETVALCFFAALYAAVFSFALLLLKRAGRKSRIPFLPFFLLGYVTMRLLVKSI